MDWSNQLLALGYPMSPGSTVETLCTYFSESFKMVYTIGMGKPLKVLAEENVYAPIFSNISHSPTFKFGNSARLAIKSNESHVGPQMEQERIS